MRDALEKQIIDVDSVVVTGVCPSVTNHFPSDKVEGWQVVKAYAAELGLCIDAVNPNLFQEDAYCLGSLSHIEKAVRQQAIDHVLECIQIAQTVGWTSSVSGWLMVPIISARATCTIAVSTCCTLCKPSTCWHAPAHRVKILRASLCTGTIGIIGIF